MRAYHSYEDWGAARDSSLYLPEAYEGTAIVQWYGNIERQLSRMLEENEASRNFVYADKLRQFIKTWRENEITGSLNRDVLMILKTATEQLAVDTWNLGNYFSNLRDQLRKLIASEEQLPRVDAEPNNQMAGPGASAPRSSTPPLTPEFGAEKEPPGMEPENAGGEPPEEKTKEEKEDEELENANAAPPPRTNA